MLKLYTDPSYIDMSDFMKAYEDWRRWVGDIIICKPLNPIKASLSYYSILNHEKLDGLLKGVAQSLPLYIYNKDKEIFIVHVALANYIVQNCCWKTEKLMGNLREVNRESARQIKKGNEEYREKLIALDKVLEDLDVEDCTIDPIILEENHEFYRMSHGYRKGCMSLSAYKDYVISPILTVLYDIVRAELDLYERGDD